jgi:PPM family protein phosphatase
VAVKAFGQSDVGRKRQNNEDAFFVAEAEGVFMVGDGMGGHKAGEVASGITRDVLQQRLLTLQDGSSIEEVIREAFLAANDKVRAEAETNEEQRGMGCTCAVLVIRGDSFYCAHVGDSRIYLFRKQELKQVTRDHSYVEELFIRGLITEEEKVDHPYRNQITRYIGCSQKLDVDITSGPIANGDLFLLCSDGLTEEISDPELQEILARQLEPEKTVAELIQKALDHGAHDNVTTIVARVVGKKTSFFKKILGW